MSPPADELLPGTRRALLHRIATTQSQGRTPSLTACVIRDGATVWTGERGMVDAAPPTEATQYRIGSLTKSLVAVLVMRLRDEGALGLADPVGAHLPGLADSYAGAVTVAQLLSHTAGLYAETPNPWWERTPGTLRPELADILRDGPTGTGGSGSGGSGSGGGGRTGAAAFPAGRAFHYSNPGFALLGAVVESVRGEPWYDTLRREVLAPLGMTRTTALPEAPYARGWAVHPWADVLLPEPAQDTGRMAPAGQLWSTAGDLGRLAAFLADGDDRVLSARSLAEMRTPAAPRAADAKDSGYGLGLQLTRVGGRSLAGHTGSMPGYLATLWVSPDDGLGAVVLTNATDGPAVSRCAADLIGIVADREPRLPAAWQPLPEVDPDLLAITGPWYWGPSPFVLRLHGDRSLELRALDGTAEAATFRAEADGTWTGLDQYYAGETLRVVRRPDGSVSHLDIGSFVFTREPYDARAPVPGGVDPNGWRGGGT